MSEPPARPGKSPWAPPRPASGWAIPDLSHDAHDGTLTEADHWLAGWLPAILSGPDFRRGGLAVVITADEDDRHSGNKVLTVVAAPGLTGKVVTAALTHYSLTGLYDDVIGVPKLRDAATAFDHVAMRYLHARYGRTGNVLAALWKAI